MMTPFENKVVLITGGSSGIGKVTALQFAERGADIVLTFKNNKQGANEVVNAVKKLGRKAVALRANLNEEKNAKKVAKRAMKAFGKINVLVNNAGGYINGDEWDGSAKIWIKSLQQNLISAMSMSKYVAPILKKQNEGIIINIASKHAVVGHADAISYGAAKAGVVNITQSYATLLKPYRVRVNCVSPSAVEAGYWLTAPKEELEERLSRTLHHKLIDPNVIAEKIIFLASDEAKDITGQNFIIE